MAQAVDFLNGLIWSKALIFLCLGVGLYFSIRTRFMQVRGFGEMIRLMFAGQKSSCRCVVVSGAGDVALRSRRHRQHRRRRNGDYVRRTRRGVLDVDCRHFSARPLHTSSARWRRSIRRRTTSGRYRGGPAYYIEKAMGQKWYALTFAVATVLATGLLLPGVQANGIAASVHNAWGVEPIVSAALIVIALGVIIFGGVTRIARFAEVVVPFMALAYILMAVVIMAIHADQVGAIFGLIFKSAFGMNAAFGAVLGLAVEWGVKRGVYSNEAGQGTGPHSAAAAEVSHPAKQGYVQAFSIYVDTLLVCSATAFMILVTGKYNVTRPDGSMIVQALPGMETGPGFTQAAVESVLPGFGASFVALAIMFFAFTTIVAYYYMAETNMQYVNRNAAPSWVLFALKVAMMVSVTYGAIRTAGLAWGLGDIGVGLMAWLNIVAIVILQKPALIALKDYEAQKKAGLDPTFNPEKLGIKNAELWKSVDFPSQNQNAAPSGVRTITD